MTLRAGDIPLQSVKIVALSEDREEEWLLDEKIWLEQGLSYYDKTCRANEKYRGYGSIEAKQERLAATKLAKMEVLASRTPKGRRMALRELYEWVLEHLRTGPEEIEAEGVPSRSAMNILIGAVASPEGEERFLARHRQICAGDEAGELSKRFEDDGRDLCEFMDKVVRRCRHSAERVRTEDADRELGVPAGLGEAGVGVA